MVLDDLIKSGKELIKTGSVEQSLKYFQKLDSQYPNNSKVLNNLAYILIRIENFLEASHVLDKAIKIDPDSAETFFYKAICLQAHNDLHGAIILFQKSIKLNSDFHLAYLNLGTLQKSLGLYDDAIETYQMALNHNVNYENIFENLSEVYLILKNFDLAYEYAQKTIKLNSSNYLALNNLATCQIYYENQAEAIKTLEKAKEINNKFFGTYYNFGLAYKFLSDYKNAISSLEDSIKLNPNFYDAYFTLGEIHLSQNNFLDGWKNYEYRWHRGNASTKYNFSKPKWEPKLGYNRLLIWGEQGIGEQVLFSSILEDLINKFDKIYLLTDSRMKEIFQSSFPNITVLSKLDKIDENLIDYHLPIGSLGLYFRSDVNQFSTKLPIFKNQNKLKIDCNTKYKCSLSWKSNNKNFANSKSIELKQMKAILNLKEVTFYNIQYTDVENEIEQLYENEGIKINNVEGLDAYNDINELVNFINGCDFTITVSNTNAHLSAALGKPTYLMLPYEAGKFWYWENEINGTNLWYPSVIKFRQNLIGEWSHPVNNLKKYLSENYV